MGRPDGDAQGDSGASFAAGKLVFSSHASRLKFFSVLAPDGFRFAYGEGTKEHLNVYLKSLSWWSFWSSTLCENCGMPRQFSPDGKKLLVWTDSPPIHRLDLFDLETRHVNRIVLMKSTKHESLKENTLPAV